MNIEGLPLLGAEDHRRDAGRLRWDQVFESVSLQRGVLCEPRVLCDQPVRNDFFPSGQRCAIYTRKSSEEGLEQEFNSLAAQRAWGSILA